MKKIAGGTVHRLPEDAKKALFKDRRALLIWDTLTPLSRNEWICWITSVKKQKTRQEHIDRLVRDLKAGKRRPCCFIGCIHRTDKPISPSVRRILRR